MAQEGENEQHFSLKEFYEKVSQVEGVDGAIAATHVRGILVTIAGSRHSVATLSHLFCSQ